MNQKLRRSGFALTLALCASCERSGPERSNDTPAVVTPPPDGIVLPPNVAVSPWDTAAGPIFLIVGANASQAAIVVPTIDSTAGLDTLRLGVPQSSATYELVLAGRRVGTAILGAAINVDAPDDCTAWPHARLQGAPDSSAGGWTVAFPEGRFAPIPFDSITALSRADSARLAMDLARIASSVPGDTVEALQGTPFVVRRAYRFTAPAHPPAVFAEITRSLNQEASPTQEHLVLVVEQDSTSPRRYRLAYAERASGTEDTLESTELLTPGTVKGRTQPVILLARYVGDGVVYALLERGETGQWRLRWSSPYAGC